MAAPPPPHCVLRGHTAEVTAAHFGQSDGAGQPLLFSAAADGELRAWSLRTHRSVASIAAHAGSSVLALHALGTERLLSQGRDGFMRVWDVHAGLCGPVLELPVRSYNFCGCAPSLALTAAAATDWEGNGGSEAGASPHLVAVPDMDAQLVVLWDLRQQAAQPLRLSAVPGEQPGSSPPPTSHLPSLKRHASPPEPHSTPPQARAPTLPRPQAGKGAGMCMSLRFVGEHSVLSGWEASPSPNPNPNPSPDPNPNPNPNTVLSGWEVGSPRPQPQPWPEPEPEPEPEPWP